MVRSEINIWVRTRAKEARDVLAAVQRDLNRISASGAAAGNVMDGLAQASAGYTVALTNTSKAAADLAAALALINKSGGAASKHVLNLGVAAELAGAATLTAAVSADALAAALSRVAGAAGLAATGLGQYTTAAKAAAAAGDKAARATRAAADSSAAANGATGRSARTAGTELATLAGAQNSVARSSRALSGDAYDLSNTIRAQATRLNADGTAWNQFDQGLKAIGTTYSRVGGESTRIAGDTAELGNEVERTAGRFDRAGERMGAFNAKLWQTSDDLRKAGSQMQWTGRQLSVMFTAPTVLLAGLGTMWALEYEKAFTRLKKVYNGDLQELGGAGPNFSGSKFDKFFTALSNRMGFAREEIADVAADFAQAGLSGTQLAKATKLTTEFSIVGDQDLKKSTEDIISVMAQYKLSADEMSETIAHLNAISNETPVSMADLTAGFVRTAAVAREAGVDVRHLGAFIASLTPQAGTAAVTANGLKSVFTRLMTPTKEAAGMLEQVGINIHDVDWMSKNAVERLAELSTKFKGLSQQQKFDLAKPFAGLYQINKFLALMDDMADAQGDYAKALAATESPAQSFATYQRELNTFLESNPQKLKQAGQIIKNSLGDAIIPLVPHIVWLAQAVAKVMKGFANLSPETQKFIVLAALALAAVGPLAMLLGSFAILFGVAGKSMAVFGKILSWTAFNMFGLGKATKQVGDDIVTRTPLIVRAWRGLMTAMRAVTTAGAFAINGIWKLGMTLFSLLLKAGGALGLKNFAWYQAAMVKVNAAAQRQIVAQTAAGQSAATAAVVAGGRAQTGAAAAGAAGTARAGKKGMLGWLGSIVSVAAMFPGVIWSGIKKIPGLFSRLGGGIKAAASQIATVFRTVLGGGTVTAVEGTLAKIMVKITTWAARAWGALTGFFPRIGPALLRALGSIAPRLGASGAAIAAGLTGPIGWAIGGVVTLITLFPGQVWDAVKGIGQLIARPFILGAKSIGWVLRQGGELVANFGRNVGKIISSVMNDDGVPLLAKPFVVAFEIIGKTLRALPGLVVSVFEAVVGVIQRAGQAIYKAFSYINPFARHSPSLVENVTGGMAIVRDEFAFSADSIAASTARAYKSIAAVGGLTAALRGRVSGMQREETLTKLNQADPQAGSAYLLLERELPGLEAQLEAVTAAIKRQERVVADLEDQIESADRVLEGMSDQLDVLRERADAASEALDAANERLDYYSNAPLVGMRAMSDAIFDNELAQKKLRLEIMKMEDAGESVDSVTDRLAALQGQIESLNGERNTLRLDGAGSDILGVYDQMLGDLQAQQGAVAEANLSPIQKAQDELEALQRRGEQLDLENSLKFDPLTRQIEQLVDTSREVTFAEATVGIRTAQGDIVRLTEAYDEASAAVAQQEAVIERAQEARDLLGDQLEVEQDRLSELTDAQGSLETAIDDVRAAMDDITAQADSLNQMLEENARKAEEAADAADDLAAAWDNAALGDFETGAGVLENFGDDMDVDKLTEDLTNEVAKMFDGIDIGGAIGRFFGRIGSWFASLPGRFIGWLVDVTVAIGKWAGGLAVDLGKWVGGLAADFGRWVGGWASAAGREIATWPGKVRSWFAGVGRAIGGWFSGVWSDHIWPALSALPGQIAQFIMDLPTHLVEAASYLLGYLAGTITRAVGASLRIGTAVRDYFLGGGFLEDVGNIWEAITSWWSENVWQPVVQFVTGTIPDIGRAVGDYFFGGGFTEDLGNIWEAITRWWSENVWQPVVQFVTGTIPDIGRSIMNYFGGGGFTADVAGVWNAFTRWWSETIWQPVVRFITQGIPDIGRSIAGYFRDGGFEADLAGIWDTLVEVGGNILEGLWDGIKAAGSNTWQWIQTHMVDPLVNGFKDALGIHSPSTVFAGFGENLVEGLWNGIKSLGSWVKDKILAWVDEHIPGPIKWALDINSPSGVTEALGVNVGEGLAQGIESQGPAVLEATQNVANQITSITLPAAPMGDVFAEFATSTGTAVEKLDILKNGLAAFRTESSPTQDVMQAVNDTMRETPAVLEGFQAAMILANGQIDTTTEAGSRMYSQIKDVQGAFDGAAASAFQSAIDQGKAVDEAALAAQDAAQKVRDTFVQQAIDAGLPQEAANRLAETYGLIPHDVFTKFNVNLDEADAEVKRFMEEDRTIRIDADIIARRLEVNRAAWESYTAEQKADNNRTAIYSGGGVPAEHRKAAGGWISGPGTTTSDSILALLSDREFVVNAKQAARYADILEQINAGTYEAGAALLAMPRFADGGAIGSLGSAMATAGTGAGALPDGVGRATAESLAVWERYVAAMTAETAVLSTQQKGTFAAMAAAVTADTTNLSAVVQADHATMAAAVQATTAAMSSGLIATATATATGLTDSFTRGRDGVTAATASMTTTVTDQFATMATNLRSIFDNELAPMFAAFDPALAAVTGWFGETVANVGSTWAGIKEPVAVPARFIVNDVYNDGIRGAWNSFNDFLALPPLPEHLARFAVGGPVRGPGTGTSDSIPALLSNQEHVVTAAEVRGAGGHAAVEATRRMWAAGKVPAFRRGGPVDLNAAPWGGGGGESNLQPAAILARRNIKKYWPEIQTIGGYRAQDAYPDHPSGLALDVMTGDPAGTEINDWLHREKDALALNYTIWKQWYKPAGGIGNLMEDRGSITQNHYDHVHALFNANGVAGIQAGGIGTLPMDQVVRDMINARMDAVAERAPQLAGGIGQWIPKSIDTARSQLLEFLVPRAAEMSKSSAAAGLIGNAESWRSMAVEAMKRNGFAWQNREQVDAMLRQIMSESTGNPNAIQQVIDVNSGGNEAAGLLQITPRTWAAHRDPTLPDNRFDPWANMNGALRYYKSRYGMDLTTMWGRGHGYDQGGLLQPTPGGYGTYYNHTGKPEMVLTSSEWDTVGALAAGVAQLGPELISDGIELGLKAVYGVAPARTEAEASAAAAAAVAEEWTPLFYGATAAQEKAAEKSVAASDRFAEVGKKIGTSVTALAQVAVEVSKALAVPEADRTFDTLAPILTAAGGFLSTLPKAEPKYVPWAGADVEYTNGMRVQKGINDIANVGKGLYNIVLSVGPTLLASTATIGSAIAKLAADNGPLISAALAMLPVNPVGAAITLIPVLLQGISTILPAIIEAITQIVPALLSSIIDFFNRFMPDSVYAHESLEAAEKAAAQRQERYRSTGSLYDGPTVQQDNSTQVVHMNIYATMPNVTNGDDAEAFVANLQALAGN